MSDVSDVSVTEDELGVSVDDVIAADVDELHSARVQHLQRCVHVVDVVYAHAPTLTFLGQKSDFSKAEHFFKKKYDI